MMTHILKIALFSFFLLSASIAYAQDIQGTEENPSEYETNVKIRVLSEHGTLKSEDNIWIGIEQSIRPHWHTYWKNAGDSGTPTMIKWDLPEGFTMSDIYWPTPKKIPYGPLINYGYENNAILLQKLTAPATLPEGPITLTAHIDLLVCKDVCIPESSTQSITLNGENDKSENNEAYISAAVAKLPQKVDWEANFTNLGADLQLTLNPTNSKIFDDLTADMIEVFPLEWGLIDNFAKPNATLADNQIVITQARADRNITDITDAEFVVVIGKGETSLSYQVKATQNIAPIQTAESAPDIPKEIEPTTDPSPTQSGLGILGALILALLGGIILNLMPCVFPVLSLKALSLVKIADEHPEQARMHGFAYTAGVVLSFMAIAALLILLKATGAEIGWGFQLQNPLVVGLLAYLLFVIGLNLYGFFEFGSSFANIGGKFIQGHGYSSSFVTGILATIVATPCTAPFMAAAIGFALTQSAIISLLVFATLGFGLALPYLILSLSPKLEKMLPKPGAWMDKFKQFLAFPMFMSAAWLTWVLSQQSGSIAVLYSLTGAILIVFAFWANKTISKASNRKTLITLSILTAIGLLIFLPAPLPHMPALQNAASHSVQNWTPETLKTALASEDPVFVEMTASWCITCKLNNKTSLSIESTQKLFAATNTQYLVGDWTNQNADITKYLASYGRNGVPLYVFYGRPDENGKRPEPEILPQLLTPNIVKKAVMKNNKNETTKPKETRP